VSVVQTKEDIYLFVPVLDTLTEQIKVNDFFLQIQPTEYRSAVLSALACSNKLFRAPTREAGCHALNAGG
jgi:hypothetical protein